MAWLVLVAAGALEIVWSLGLKYTRGFTQPLPSAVTVLAMIGSMLLLAHATRTLPIGTSYAVWVGIGAVGASVGGVMLFHEPLTLARSAFTVLLVVSIVGLKATA